MKKSTTLALALTLGLGMAAHAAIVSVDSASASFPGSNGTTPAQMIDGILSADTGSYPTVTPLTEANKLTLVSNSGYGFVGAGGGQFIGDNTDGGTVTFNFTDATVGEILLWNYSQNADRGLDSITKVEVMTDGSTWVDQGLSMVLADAGTANFQAQTLDLSGAISGVDGIRLTVAQAITGGTETAGGFDEVAFSTIPEPATLSLVALFGGATLLIRRKLMI